MVVPDICTSTFFRNTNGRSNEHVAKSPSPLGSPWQSIPATEMQGDEARLLLGFPPNSRPSYSQIKAAYRKKVLECHPDRVPQHLKPSAESQFKMISEAYNCMRAGNLANK
ncbi:unnamed protein product [Rhodiola kirilowii]